MSAIKRSAFKLGGCLGGELQDIGRKWLGFMGTIVVLGILGSLAQCVNGALRDHEMKSGPIPRAFHGSFNTLGCGGGVDGLITVDGKHINFGSVSFLAEKQVSATSTVVVLSGRSTGLGVSQSDDRATLSLSPEGDLSINGESPAKRCS